jgi:hypothetical protein
MGLGRQKGLNGDVVGAAREQVVEAAEVRVTIEEDAGDVTADELTDNPGAEEAGSAGDEDAVFGFGHAARKKRAKADKSGRRER